MIKIRLSTIDNFNQTRSFKTLAGAQAYAHSRVGATPTLGRTYAIDDHGVAKIMVEGATLAEIFPGTVEPKSRFLPCTGNPEILQYGGDCNCTSCCAYEVSFEAKEEALADGATKDEADDAADQAFAAYVERQAEYHRFNRAVAAHEAKWTSDDEIPF